MFWVITAALQPSADPAQGVKSPVPDERSRQKVLADLHQVFKAEYAQKTREARRALALKLLETGRSIASDPAVPYVSLMEAQNIAADGVDLETAFSAITSVVARYDLPGTSAAGMKLAAILRAQKQAKGEDEAARLAGACLSTSQEAIEGGEFDVAGDAAKEGGRLARASGLRNIAEKAAVLLKEIGALKRDAEGVKDAELALSITPEDAGANLKVGLYNCLIRGEWAKGLPCLLKGSDAGLKELARKELAPPSNPEEKADLGEGWTALAQMERNPEIQSRYADRAWHWYNQSVSGAEGLLKVKVRKAMAALAALQGKAARMPLEGIFAWWEFERDSDGRISDSSGRGVMATAHGPAPAPGKVGKGLAFEKEGDHILLGGDDLPPPWTLALWLFKKEVESPCKFLMDSGAHGLRLEQIATVKKVGFTKYGVQDYSFDYTAPANRWVHLTFVCSEADLRLYADGKEVGTNPSRISLPMVRFGARGGYHLGAVVDDVLIYQRALGPFDIERLVLRGK